MNEEERLAKIKELLAGKLSPLMRSILLTMEEHPAGVTLGCESWSLVATSDNRVLLSIDAKDLATFMHTADDLRELCQNIANYLLVGGVIDNTTNWSMVLEDNLSEHTH